MNASPGLSLSEKPSAVGPERGKDNLAMPGKATEVPGGEPPTGPIGPDGSEGTVKAEVTEDAIGPDGSGAVSYTHLRAHET